MRSRRILSSRLRSRESNAGSASSLSSSSSTSCSSSPSSSSISIGGKPAYGCSRALCASLARAIAPRSNLFKMVSNLFAGGVSNLFARFVLLSKSSLNRLEFAITSRAEFKKALSSSSMSPSMSSSSSSLLLLVIVLLIFPALLWLWLPPSLLSPPISLPLNTFNGGVEGIHRHSHVSSTGTRYSELGRVGP